MSNQVCNVNQPVNPSNAAVLEEPIRLGDDRQEYLNIQEIKSVEPLDAQFGVWPKKVVPDVLYDPLFGQPEPSEDEIKAVGDATHVSPMKLYAILEAAKVENFFGMLDASGLNYRCLYKGNAYDALKDVAPYIVELTEDNDFTRSLLTKGNAPWDLWDKELGIYIRSRAPLDELRQHFRKFTKIKDENGQWFFFRFYDPKVLKQYLVSLSLPIDEISAFVQSHQYVIVCGGDLWLVRKNKGCPSSSSVAQHTQLFQALRKAKALAFRERICKDLGQGDPSKEVLIKHLFQEAIGKKYRTEKSVYNYVLAGTMAKEKGLNFAALEKEIHQDGELLSDMDRSIDLLEKVLQRT